MKRCRIDNLVGWYLFGQETLGLTIIAEMALETVLAPKSSFNGEQRHDAFLFIHNENVEQALIFPFPINSNGTLPVNNDQHFWCTFGSITHNFAVLF